jgi:hypothetical protein
VEARTMHGYSPLVAPWAQCISMLCSCGKPMRPLFSYRSVIGDRADEELNPEIARKGLVYHWAGS